MLNADRRVTFDKTMTLSFVSGTTSGELQVLNADRRVTFDKTMTLSFVTYNFHMKAFDSDCVSLIVEIVIL